MAVWPLSNPRVSDRFGWRIHPIHGGRRFHYGTDYAAAGGTELLAVQRAKVVAKGYGVAGAGHWVTIESISEPGLQWSYWHMNQASPLQRGQTIAEGSVVGWVGTTGSSTGNHLHLEQYFHGAHMDAHEWLLVATSVRPADPASPGTLQQDMLLGVDISRWQESVDYGRLSSAVGFAYLKAGGSNTGSAYTDSRYNQHGAGLATHLETVGSYWMNGRGDPIADAKYFLSILRSDADAFVALDLEHLENEGVAGWNPTQALAWIREVRKGYMGPIFAYMNSAFAAQYDWAPVEAETAGLILANYGANNGSLSSTNPGTGTWSTWKVHQYTDAGTIPGISGGVDLNRAKPGVFTSLEGDLTVSQVNELMKHITSEAEKTRKLISVTAPVRAITYKDGPDKGKIFMVSTRTGNRVHIPNPDFYVLNQAFGLFVGDAVTAEGHVAEHLRNTYRLLADGTATQASLDATRDELLTELGKLSPAERKALIESPENIGALEVVEVSAESAETQA